MKTMSVTTERASDHDVIDLQEVFGNLWRGKLIILLTMAAFCLFGLYYSNAVATPLYTSTSVVILDQRESDVTNLGNVLGDLSGDSVTLNSEVEVLRSRSLLEKVVNKLDLLSDPEFNPDLRAMSQLDMFKSKVSALLGGGIAAHEAISDNRRSVIIAVNKLQDKLTVQVAPNTFVIRITVVTDNGAKSAMIAQTVAETYVSDQIEAKFQATEDATAWLANRVSELQVDLERTQAEVKAFEAKTELINIDILTSREIQLKDLRERIELTKSIVERDFALLDSLEQAEDPAEIVSLSKDTQLQNLLPKLEGNPELRAAFDDEMNALMSRLERNIARSKVEIETMQNSAEVMSAQVDRQNEELIQLQQLQRTAETNRVLYEHFLTRLKETSAQQGLHNSDSRVLSRAEVPFGPTSPKKKLVVAMCLVLGAVIGSAFVLLRDVGANVYRTAEELEAATGENTLGQIPVLPFVDRDKVLAYLNENRTSPAAEAIRNLRTSIFLSGTTPPQVICLSSSIPGEGKSTLSLGLAQNAAQMGKKVLVIEGDMRRRIFTSFSKAPSKRGFISVVEAKASLEEVVTFDSDLGADILHAEPSEVNPADLFASQGFTDLISMLREKYDLIVIDSPPLLVVPDARILAKHVDAMLLVVKWNTTTKSMVQESLRELEKVGMRHPGMVLNQINFKKMQSYGYGGRYGSYQSYQGYYNT